MKNENVKNVRLRLGMKQADFGYRIGLSQIAISSIELGTRKLTDRTFKDVCRVYKVREEYLKNGTGEMFIQPEEMKVPEVLELMMKAYNKLTREEQQVFNKMICNLIKD